MTRKGLAPLVDADATGQRTRITTHVRRALHIVLPAQGVHARTGPADIARQQRKIDQGHDRFNALYMLSHTETVHHQGWPCSGIETRRLADQIGIDTAQWRSAFGCPVSKMPLHCDEAVCTRRNKFAVIQALAHDHLRHRIEEWDVAARPQGQMQIGDRRQFDAARVNDNQPRAAPHRLADALANHRMVFGGIGPADQNQSSTLNIVEGISRCTCA